MFHTIVIESAAVEGGAVTTVTLNRPDRRNAIGPEMVNELLYALEMAANDPSVRALVLTGAGGTFCAGGDLGQMSGAPAVSTLPIKGDYADLLRAMVNFQKPILAKVRGAAMGGGLGLVAASHFALASNDAVLGTPEINRGLFPMMIMAVLARTVSRRALLEMMLVGAKHGAEDALRMGLLNRVTAPEKLDEAAHALALSLAAKSPTAVAHGLAAYAKQGDMALDEALPMLRESLYTLLATEDAREGLMAFMEKRAPRWTGR